MPRMDDPNFAQTVTYLVEHNEQGAMGLVINRPNGLNLSDVLEQLRPEIDPPARCQTLPIYAGGPGVGLLVRSRREKRMGQGAGSVGKSVQKNSHYRNGLSMSPPSTPAPSSPTVVTWPDPSRELAFQRWLDSIAGAHQLHPATLRPASADASFRRYLRIDAGAGSRIIMDAPPDKEDCHPFVKVAQLMADAGLHVPRVLAWDEQAMIEVVDAANPG
eukprot:gene46723-57217_t